MRTQIEMKPLDVLSNSASTNVFGLFEDDDGLTSSSDKRCRGQAGNAASNDSHIVVPHLIARHFRSLLTLSKPRRDSAHFCDTPCSGS
jgi:hypothetical protein